MKKNLISAVIINRNLGTVCDNLVIRLQSFGIKEIYVVEASTSTKLQSKFANVYPNDVSVTEKGLRINRGFNLGIHHAISKGESEWIFCLPVDTELINCDLNFLISQQNLMEDVAGIVPLEHGNSYLNEMHNREIAIAWNLPEGPILLRRSFLNQFQSVFENSVFDHNNFRGYLSFIEIAIRIYSSNFALAVTKNITYQEREDYLLSMADLIKTEPLEINKYLLIEEGKKWLFEKYGFHNRWQLENIARLTYEEFLRINPKFKELAI